MRFASACPLIVRPLIALALCAALAGCGQKAADNGASKVSNAVVEGSASDAMIEFDQLRSQGQQAEPTDAATEDANGTRRRTPAAGGDAGAGETPATDEPGATPAAEPSAPASEDEG